MMNVIELRGVTRIYNGRRVVDNLSFAVADKERIVLFGPSGCGKTTVLRLIAGFEVPDNGEILIDGRRVAVGGHSFVEPEHRNLGMVFQDLALWPHMTVKQHLNFVLRTKATADGDRTRRISEVLDMVRLSDFADYKPAQLSGGQQQRVAIARALVATPNIILMDEPLSSLDDELHAHLTSEIVRLQTELGFSVLYVSHNNEEVLQVGTRVIKMRKAGAGGPGASADA